MRRFAIAIALASLMLASVAPAVLGAHKHYLQTPGTCVEDIARGQTRQTSGGGFHRFHENVHLGQPGMSGGAFERAGTVSVGKSATGDCPTP